MNKLIVVSDNKTLITMCDLIKHNERFANNTAVSNLTVFNNPEDARLKDTDLIINACNPLENSPELDADFYNLYKESKIDIPIYRMSFSDRALGFSKNNVINELLRIETSALSKSRSFNYKDNTLSALSKKYNEIKDVIKPAESLMEEDRIYLDFELD